jgi:hypothetical protein
METVGRVDELSEEVVEAIPSRTTEPHPDKDTARKTTAMCLV